MLTSAFSNLSKSLNVWEPQCSHLWNGGPFVSVEDWSPVQCLAWDGSLFSWLVICPLLILKEPLQSQWPSSMKLLWENRVGPSKRHRSPGMRLWAAAFGHFLSLGKICLIHPPVEFLFPLMGILSLSALHSPVSKDVIWPGFPHSLGFPHSSVGKESACNAGDPGSVPGLGRSPGEGNGNPLQYPCLENPRDRGAWRAIVHGVAKSQTRLSDLTTTTTNPLAALCLPVHTGLCRPWSLHTENSTRAWSARAVISSAFLTFLSPTIWALCLAYRRYSIIVW